MPQADSATQPSWDNPKGYTRVQLKDGSKLLLKGEGLNAKQVADGVTKWRASQGGRGAAPTSAPTTTPPNSITGGAARRARDLIVGALGTVGAPPSTSTETTIASAPFGSVALPIYRVGKGIVSGEKEAAGQARTQAKQGVAALRKGQYEAGGLRMAQAGVTAASALDPLATSSVTNINKLEAENRNREAIGQSAVDILAMVVGGTKSKGISNETRLNNLVAATGSTGETLSNFRSVLPDIQQTVKQMGGGNGKMTIGDLYDVVDKTSRRVDQDFNAALYPVRNQSVIPSEISRAILDQITPDMQKTAAGRVEAAQLRKAASEYTSPWTLRELNAKRMTENSNLTSFYKKESQGQSAAMSNVDVKVSKAVRDGSAEIVYREVNRANPGMDTAVLKRKQGALWSLQDQLSDRVGKLADKQAEMKGQTIRQKIHPGTYASTRGVHGYVSGLSNLIPGGGPEEAAETQVTRALRQPRSSVTRRAILALPASTLTSEQDQQEK